MQTRKPGLRALTLALAGVLTLGLAACDETEVVQPGEDTTLTISPSGTIDLEVGDRVTVVANPMNAPTGATIAWASSDNAVATVDQSGNVTAVAPGIATITASVTGNDNETVRAALAVRVTGTEPGPGGDGDASVFITGITDADGDGISTNDVSGTIIVRLEVEPGSSDSLVVSLGDRRACAISFSSAGALLTADGQEVATAQIPLSCTVNTATLGVGNGQVTLAARLIDNGEVVASNGQTITLNNASTVAASISGDTTANNPQTGLVWHDGDVTVNVTPALFGDEEIARVTVSLNGDNIDDLDAVTDSTATDGVFSVTFEEDDLEGIVDATLFATVAATTTSGQQFNFPLSDGTTATSLNTASIRYDNEAPTVDADFLSDEAVEFLGAGDFSELVDLDDIEEDTGVDDVDIVFFVSDDTDLDAEEIIAEGNMVESAEELEEGEEFILAAQVCDELGNCVDLEGFTFTVDLTAPEIVDVAPEDTAVVNVADPDVDPDDDFVVAVSDDVSGFDGVGLMVSATRTFLDADDEVETACIIGDEATTATTDAAYDSEDESLFTDSEVGSADSTCEPIQVGGAVPLPDAAGYYTFQFQAIDAAGNVSSDTETVMVLVDEALPEIDDLDFSASLDGGESETITATLTDNLDLSAYSTGVSFNDAFGAEINYLPLTAQAELDDSFGAPLTVDEDVSQDVFFIATITEDTDDDEGFTPFGQDDADEVSFFVGDQAENTTLLSGTIAQSFTAPTGAEFLAVIGGYDVEVVGADGGDPEDTQICIDDCDDADDSRTIRAIVSEDVADDADSPIEQVFFYVQIDGANYLLEVDDDATTSVTTTERSFTFTTTLTSEFLLGLTGESVEDGDVISIFGVAVDEDGNAIFEFAEDLTAVDE